MSSKDKHPHEWESFERDDGMIKFKNYRLSFEGQRSIMLERRICCVVLARSGTFHFVWPYGDTSTCVLLASTEGIRRESRPKVMWRWEDGEEIHEKKATHTDTHTHTLDSSIDWIVLYSRCLRQGAKVVQAFNRIFVSFLLQIISFVMNVLGLK